MDPVRQALRGWFLATCLPGEPETALVDDRSLRDQGVLDSMRRIQLVAFLEERFDLVVERADLRSGAFDTVDSLVVYVKGKA